MILNHISSFHQFIATIGQRAIFPSNQKVIYKTSKPLNPTGGFVGLKGNLAPEGAIVKVAGMKRKKFKGIAKCFDSEKLALKALMERKIKKFKTPFIFRYFNS